MPLPPLIHPCKPGLTVRSRAVTQPSRARAFQCRRAKLPEVKPLIFDVDNAVPVKEEISADQAPERVA